jgi:hypothetical protein
MIHRSAALAIVITLVCLPGVAGAQEELKPGMTLGPDTAALAKDLLPPDVLRHYEKGEYVNPIVAWPEDVYTWPVDFLAGTKTNAGKYAIRDGAIVDKATGKQPPYIFGFPFPTITPDDPQAGAKAIWNFKYRTWYFGNLKAESQINMLDPKRLARRLDVTASFFYYDGVPPADRPKDNAGNFMEKQLTVVESPADVNGTAALTWRYRDPGKRDSSWTYVPALRRVRQVSPANRSDGFLGSDFAQDDGTFFEAKPEDFTWKLVGEKEQLRLVDPLNLKGESKIRWVKGGGWDVEWPDIPFIGYMDPKWKGIAWAPRTAALAKRPFWVIEGVPKDRYYLYGKLELYVDKIAYQGAWVRKYDWKGDLVQNFQVMAYDPHEKTRPDGTKDWIQGSNMAYQTAESLKFNRATVAGIKTTPTSVFLTRAPFTDAIFSLDALPKWGK